MALATWYSTGTVSVESGSTTVTGSDLYWGDHAIMPGDLFCDPAQPLIPPQRVKEVTSDDTLELWAPWPGADLAADKYEIRYVGIVERSTAQTRKVIEELGSVTPSFDVKVDTIADRNALETAADPLRKGYRVLVSNVGDGRAAVYAKASSVFGDWDQPAFFSGPALQLDVVDVQSIPFGDPPAVELEPRPGGYDMSFAIPEGMRLFPGTVTTLPADQQAQASFVSVTGGYRLDLALPRGATGNIEGVTSFWHNRITNDPDASAARKGLGLGEGRHLEEFGDISEAGDATDAMIAAAEWVRSQETIEPGGIPSAAALLILPSRRIVIEQSINLQGIDACGWVIDGAGCVIEARCQDRYLFDMLGSRWSSIRDLRVVGHETIRPAGVLLRGRLSGLSAGSHQLLFPKFSGFFSDACVFDLATEVNATIGGELANTDESGNAHIWITDGSNSRTADWSAKTDYQQPSLPQHTSISCTGHDFFGTTFRNQISGPAIWLGNITGVRFVNSYWVSADDAAIVLYDNGGGLSNINLEGYAETAGLKSVVRFERRTNGALNVRGFKMHSTSAHASDEIMKLGTNVTSLNIEDGDIAIYSAMSTPINGLFDNDQAVSYKGKIYTPASTWIEPENMAGFSGVFDADDLLSERHITRNFDIRQYDDGLINGPKLDLVRVSQTPAAGDQIGNVRFIGRNSTDGEVPYANLMALVLNPAASSESGRIDIMTMQGGALGHRAIFGGGLYHPSASGGDKGNNTINFGAVYDDNVLLTDYVFDKWLSEGGSYTQRVQVKYEELDSAMFDVATHVDFMRENKRLYGMPDLNDCIDGVVKDESLGGMVQRLWQALEIAQIHIAELHDRLKSLEYQSKK